VKKAIPLHWCQTDTHKVIDEDENKLTFRSSCGQNRYRFFGQNIF